MALLQQGRCLVRDVREAAGLTLQQLSDKLLVEFNVSLSTTHLSRIERDERPMTSIIQYAISLVLECPQEKLIDWIIT